MICNNMESKLHNGMSMPILDSVNFVAGKTLKSTKPRRFDTAMISGAYKVIDAVADDTPLMSDILYGNIDAIEQLMVLNERKSPFDFEADDVIVVPETSSYLSLTIEQSIVANASTQPANHGKTSEQKLLPKSTSASVAANQNASHVKINSSIGKLTF